MSSIYNFSAGPAMLPADVLRQAQEEMLDWHGSGVSVMEMSHRGKAFTQIAAEAEQDLRDLLSIPDNYKVLFLQGGASAQFSMIPINLLGDKTQADYVLTGHWGKKAIAEAKRFCTVNIAADSSDKAFSYIPPMDQWQLSDEAAYVHYTPNETIAGAEFNFIPEVDKPLVADYSSSILSAPLDVSKFGLIYAGAQKNIGPSGLTVVIVREDLLGQFNSQMPTTFDYALQAENGSMYNTPPTYAWYLSGLVFKWLKQQGGLAAIEKINQKKAATLYTAIDTSSYYSNPVDHAARSIMNIPFTLADDKADAYFLELAEKEGLQALKGHRSTGGMRASIYNAMPQQGIDALVAFMQHFEQQHA